MHLLAREEESLSRFTFAGHQRLQQLMAKAESSSPPLTNLTLFLLAISFRNQSASRQNCLLKPSQSPPMRCDDVNWSHCNLEHPRTYLPECIASQAEEVAERLRRTKRAVFCSPRGEATRAESQAKAAAIACPFVVRPMASSFSTLVASQARSLANVRPVIRRWAQWITTNCLHTCQSKRTYLPIGF